MKTIGQSLEAALDNASVDRMNADFYGKIQYPGSVQALEQFPADGFWSRLLSQDVGYWGSEVLPARPKIWVAGCGRNQALITALKFPEAEVLGSDLSAASLASCEANAKAVGATNLRLRCESLNEVTYADEFDYVICTGVIHHNADPSIPLATLSRALKPDGVLELMVYNAHHRIQTASFQEAIRRLLGTSSSPDLGKELPIAKRVIASFDAPCTMTPFLEPFRNPELKEAHFCDALLQPVEHSYTVASLRDLASGSGLEYLTFAIDKFSKSNGALSWNFDFKDADLNATYLRLPDVERWQITNALLLEASPMLWFYFQKKDCSRPRKSEAQIAEEFLTLRMRKAETSKVVHILRPDGAYQTSGKTLRFPAGGPGEHVRRLYDALDEQVPIGQKMKELGMDTSFAAVNVLRIQLATSAFPFIRAVG